MLNRKATEECGEYEEILGFLKTTIAGCVFDPVSIIVLLFKTRKKMCDGKN